MFISLVIFFTFILWKKTPGVKQPPPPTSLPSTKNTPSKIIPFIKLLPFPLSLPETFEIGVFAEKLGNPRDLEFSPKGTLLASITNSGKIVALPDADHDGVTDKTVELLTKLNKPHGLAFFDGKLFVAEETRVTRYLWDEEKLMATLEKEIIKLPGSQGGHFTRSIVFNKQGQLFITIGSTCNVCIESNPWHASVMVTDQDGNNSSVFAKGLRNTVFLTVNPQTNELWGADMGRDLLGDNIPPEEINIIREGKDYGWPICYSHKIPDKNFVPELVEGLKESPCIGTEPPAFEFQAHSAPLGLTFIDSPQFPTDWQGDLLVVFHGSWNRSTKTGYKIVRMNIEGDRIVNTEDFLTGFLDGDSVHGRPVDVIFDAKGDLFVSDDKAGYIYKIILSGSR